MIKKDGGAIKKQAIADGMRTFRDHGIQKILQGITTIEEVLANTQVELYTGLKCFMPIFEYRGLNHAGKNLRGTIDAENLRTARAKLKKDGIFVVDLKDKGKEQAKNKKKPGSGKKISIDEISMMTRQLSTLIKAKIPLVESLAAVSDQVENETLKEATADITELIRIHIYCSNYSPAVHHTLHLPGCCRRSKPS